MPGSPSVAPFCIPSGSTCCGDTFCNAGESCCGAGCCAAVSLFLQLPPPSLPFIPFPFTPLLRLILTQRCLHRTPPATSNSPAPAAVLSAKSAPVLSTATTAPRQTARTKPSRFHNAVPPTHPFAATSTQAVWAAMPSPRPRPPFRACPL